jgi:hypothetical protein
VAVAEVASLRAGGAALAGRFRLGVGTNDARPVKVAMGRDIRAQGNARRDEAGRQMLSEADVFLLKMQLTVDVCVGRLTAKTMRAVNHHSRRPDCCRWRPSMRWKSGAAQISIDVTTVKRKAGRESARAGDVADQSKAG